MLKKFEAMNGTGDLFVNPVHVVAVKADGLTGGVRIKLMTGDDIVVVGELAEVAKQLGHS